MDNMILFAIVVIVLVVGWIALRAKARSSSRLADIASAIPQKPSRSQVIRVEKTVSAKEMLQEVSVLQTKNAMWPEILQSLNPDNDEAVNARLVNLRGPHMFVPHVGLNVLREGCNRVIATNPNASVMQALDEALRRVGIILKAGD